MQHHDIIFLILKETASFFHMLEEDPAALTLTHYLYEAGVQDVALFPEKESDKYIAEIESAFEHFLAKHSATIYCISCWTSTYAVSMDFAKKIRDTKPESIIVAGGPHFFSIDEIRHTLGTGLVDVVFKGGGEPFLKFAESLFVDKTVRAVWKEGRAEFEGNLPAKGMYVLKDGILSGRGSGTFPYPVVPMVGEANDYIEIRTMLNDSCTNACDYCVIEHSRTDEKYIPALEQSIKNTLEQIEKPPAFETILSLSDSSPFSRANRPATVKFLENVKKQTSFDGMNVFIDSSDLDEDFRGIVERFNISTFFIGRDRVVEDAFVGRKFNGRLRTAKELDDERQVLKDFLCFLDGRKTQRKQEVFLGYILSPYETESGSRKLFQEIIDFSARTSDENHLRVQSNLFLLNPYPGTAVARRAAGDFIPMRYFYHPYPNAWIGEDTVGIYLEMVRLIVAKMFCNSENVAFYRPILQLAHDMQFKCDFDYRLLDDINDVNLRNFASMLVDTILTMNLGSEERLDDYFSHILKIYYLGCMMAVVMYRPEYMNHKGLYDKIVKEDGAAELLKKDFRTLKNLALQNKAKFYSRYIA